MSTNYDDQIKDLELKYKLEGQKNALTRVELECLRLKQKIESYDATRTSLQNEIKITEDEVLSLKGGDNK
jgi:hypothetical protein